MIPDPLLRLAVAFYLQVGAGILSGALLVVAVAWLSLGGLARLGRPDRAEWRRAWQSHLSYVLRRGMVVVAVLLLLALLSATRLSVGVPGTALLLAGLLIWRARPVH